MGEKTDKASGRVKQAAGALTGDDDTKREGERQEDKGKIKEGVNDAVDATQDAIDGVRKKITRS